tara:strand:- start:65 stop:844 length:780 start_codon:yes stop_codon:yes gene_type:complete
MLFYNNIDSIKSYIYFPENKENLYDLTKNNDLLFLQINSKNYYKSLLKSFNSGIIIKLLDWDNNLLKKEYLISIKLKHIINFIDYISYFEFEVNIINYINNINNINIYNSSENEYINKFSDEKSVIMMHNYSLYHTDFTDFTDEININNIYIQLILALYSAYINHNVYFNYLNSDFIYIIKNKSKKKYRYFQKNKKVYLNDCCYKIIICDLSNYNLLNNNNLFNIHDKIYNLIYNLNLFNKNIEFTKKNYNYIKKKYIF